MRVTIPAMLITTIAGIEITDKGTEGISLFCRRAGSHDDSVRLSDAAVWTEKRLGQPPSADD